VGQLFKRFDFYPVSVSLNALSPQLKHDIELISPTASLDLSFNRIEGTILPDISALTNITFLDLSYNELYGSIGTYMGSLSNLGKSLFSNVTLRIYILMPLEETLKIENNFLTGKLPASLKSLTKMSKF
jgi:Leucine Rich Repeat